MDPLRHHVSGFYAYRKEAEITLNQLIARGLPRAQLHIFDANSVAPPQLTAPEAGSDAVSGKKEGWLGQLISDAITSGQFVLVVQTNNEQEVALAREVIEDSVGNYHDINSV